MTEVAELVHRLENVGMKITGLQKYDGTDADWGVMVELDSWDYEKGKMVQQLDGFEFVGQVECSDTDTDEVVALELYYVERSR